MRCRPRPTGGKQRGFTLIEVIVALAIAAILGIAIVSIIPQTLHVNAQSTQYMVVSRQMQNAGYWVSNDVQMAQTVTPNDGSGFPLQLTWVTWSGDVTQVTYSLVGDKFQRSLSTNGGQPSQSVVAQQINADSAMTNCQFNSGVLTFKVTAQDGTTSGTRTYQIKARPETTS